MSIKDRLEHHQDQQTHQNHLNYSGGIDENKVVKKDKMFGINKFNEPTDHYSKLYDETL